MSNTVTLSGTGLPANSTKETRGNFLIVSKNARVRGFKLYLSVICWFYYSRVERHQGVSTAVLKLPVLIRQRRYTLVSYLGLVLVGVYRPPPIFTLLYCIFIFLWYCCLGVRKSCLQPCQKVIKWKYFWFWPNLLSVWKTAGLGSSTHTRVAVVLFNWALFGQLLQTSGVTPDSF